MRDGRALVVMRGERARGGDEDGRALVVVLRLGEGWD